MTYLARSLPLVLCCALLLAGCATWARTGEKTPQGTPTAILVTPGAERGIGANLGGSVVIQATPALEIVPTVDPLIAQLSADVKASNERADAAMKLVNDQAERIANAYRDAAIANEQTAKQGAAQAETERQTQVEITAQTANQNRHTELLTALAEAEARRAEANARTVLALCVTALFFCAGLLCARALARHPLPVVTEHSEAVTRPFVPLVEAPHSYGTRPLPVEPDLMYRFMLYATQGKPLGTNNMESAGILKSTERNERSKIITYLDELKHLAHDSGLVLTDAAITYWREWCDLYSPGSTQDIAETAVLTRHDYDNHGHDVAGGVVVDEPDTLYPSPFTAGMEQE